MPNYSPRRTGNRARPSPATAAFVIVVTAIGAVTRAFGVDAGLIALVFATVALVLGPWVFSEVDYRPVRSDDPGPDADPEDSSLDDDRNDS